MVSRLRDLHDVVRLPALLSRVVSPESASVNELTELIKKGEFSMAGGPWEHISDEAKDLISNLIVVDPEKRFEPDTVLSHRWFFESSDLPLLRQVDSAHGRAPCRRWSSTTSRKTRSA